MFKRLKKNKKAQNTAEYAILIALVVAAAIAMQTYVQRSLQARVRGAADYLQTQAADVDGIQALGTERQYEPYYLSSNYQVFRTEREGEILNADTTSKTLDTRRTRAQGGFQESNFDATGMGQNE